jgi:aromatic-amino-acid transaminase
MSLFNHIDEAPKDPIFGITELFNADPKRSKINLSVGVYLTDDGKIPLLQSVQQATKQLLESPKPHSYLPIQGMAPYCTAVQSLLFGEGSETLTQERAVTVQTLGGTGGLKVGADFLKSYFPNATVAISDPSWENHRALFEFAGFPVVNYTYYDEKTHGVNFQGMLDSLINLPLQSIVVLHACCHNPTGIDLSLEQWAKVIDVCRKQVLIPFLDMAYQGFASDVASDAQAVRLFAQSGISFLVSNSFSKSFSLYGERIGALTVVTQNRTESANVLSQIKRFIRTNYSNPPTFGAAIVTAILSNPELHALWEKELGDMRRRIQSMRQQLVSKLNSFDFSFINQQQGMFSYSGLSAEQALQLREDHSVYILPTGRICIAALNSNNIDVAVKAITAVI